MGSALDQLAQEVGVHERTLRRAAASGLIHALWPSPHRTSLSDSETAWVRSHWRLVGELLAVLRTEPNLELAVLFGSVARGDDVSGDSDVDLLVGLHRFSPGALEDLRRRLDERLQLEVQLVPLQVAQRDPQLLAEVLRDGRPLADRGQIWPQLQAQREQTREQASLAGRELRDEAHAALGYFQRLAARRAPSATGAAR
jgi:predicted nucleotidyltransferase